MKDDDSIRRAMKYSNVVINLIGRDWETKLVVLLASFRSIVMVKIVHNSCNFYGTNYNNNNETIHILTLSHLRYPILTLSSMISHSHSVIYDISLSSMVWFDIPLSRSCSLVGFLWTWLVCPSTMKCGCFCHRNYSFERVHVDVAAKIARLAKEMGVERYFHISHLNAQPKPTPIYIEGGSKFLRSKVHFFSRHHQTVSRMHDSNSNMSRQFFLTFMAWFLHHTNVQ